MPRDLPPGKHRIPALNPHDVLVGKGRKVHENPGNVRFHSQFVPRYVAEYHHPKTQRNDKQDVARRLVREIRRSEPPGRFLREVKDAKGRSTTGVYLEIGDVEARSSEFVFWCSAVVCNQTWGVWAHRSLKLDRRRA